MLRSQNWEDQFTASGISSMAACVRILGKVGRRSIWTLIFRDRVFLNCCQSSLNDQNMYGLVAGRVSLTTSAQILRRTNFRGRSLIDSCAGRTATWRLTFPWIAPSCKHGHTQSGICRPFSHSVSRPTPCLRHGRTVCEQLQYTGGAGRLSEACSVSVQLRQFSSGSGTGSGWGADDAAGGAASSSGGQDGEDSGSGSGDDGEVVYDQTGQEYPTMTTALATMTVPDFFPNVPVIAVKRNPCFPRFIKMIEVR